MPNSNVVLLPLELGCARISLPVAYVATQVGHMYAVLLSIAQETIADMSIWYQLRML